MHCDEDGVITTINGDLAAQAALTQLPIMRQRYALYRYYDLNRKFPAASDHQADIIYEMEGQQEQFAEKLTNIF